MNRVLLIILGGVFAFWNVGFSQAARTINGTFNNQQQVSWGSAMEELPRLVSTDYADGISSPGGVNRPNPRIISNEIFAQDGLINDPGQLSDFLWVFGQFIDHDVIAVTSNPTEPVMIPVDFIDPIFNPTGGLQVLIPMSRSNTAPGTGTSQLNPRQHFNEITSWLDASAVYGSNNRLANWLRTFSDGKLKTSSGEFLPFNTVDGELSSGIDPDAPHMENENPFNDKLFVAGDGRVNENPLLITFHTLFVREHNRRCDELILLHPDWDDEELYQAARRWVGALLQVITFEEWLPVMGVHLPPYQGYDPSINPTISNIFSAAAFRLGHTLLNGNIMRLDEQGAVIPEGNLTLRQAFFNPLVVLDTGLDPLLKGMAVQVMQDMDSKVIDDVRNFLFGAPGSGLGGLDLAAININRGRERGIPDFNRARIDLGLPAYTSFIEMCSKPDVAAKLEDLYGDINNIDAWVGMLAEDHLPNALFGETIMTIMMQQFQDLRDGDRFYYRNDPAFSPADVTEIESTRMHDVIMRNSNVEVMQDSVFVAREHPLACAATAAYLPVGGAVQTEDGTGIGGVALSIDGYNDPLDGAETENDGQFMITDVPACYEYTLTPEKNGAARNGVSTFDLILIAQHITRQGTLDSPYKRIAADVNNSQSITTFDIVELRKLILFINPTFPNNDSWRFLPADFQFSDPNDPFQDVFPTSVSLPELTDEVNTNFVGIKIGDVNNSADPNALLGVKGGTRTVAQTIPWQMPDQGLTAGEAFLLPVYGDQTSLIGFQLGLQFDPKVMEIQEVVPSDQVSLAQEHFVIDPVKGTVTMSWNGKATTNPDQPLFYLRGEAKQEVKLGKSLQLLDHQRFHSEAYSQQLDQVEIALEWTPQRTVEATAVLWQNQPNPFTETTMIHFQLPDERAATIRVLDVSGKVVLEQSGVYQSGLHQLRLNRDVLPAQGLYFYQLQTADGLQTKKMIVK